MYADASNIINANANDISAHEKIEPDGINVHHYTTYH